MMKFAWNGLKILFALFFLTAGLMHFLKTDFYLSMMPSYLPFHRGLILISGAAEMLAGGLLLFERTRPAGAWLAFWILIAVFPANVHLALNQDVFPSVPSWVYWVRLPFQGIFLGWAWLFTRPRPS